MTYHNDENGDMGVDKTEVEEPQGYDNTLKDHGHESNKDDPPRCALGRVPLALNVPIFSRAIANVQFSCSCTPSDEGQSRQHLYHRR